MSDVRGAAPRKNLRIAGALALLAAAVFAAFLPALSAGFQEIWDDNENITENGWFRGLGGAELGWMFTTFRLGHWQPLSWMSLAVDHALWGLDPFGYHLTNLVLHAVNAALFFVLCRAVMRAAGSPAAGPIFPALWAALFFAVHPLRVESVAWVTERRDVLSTAFLLLTLIAWLRRHETGERKWLVLAVCAYVPALLAKAWGITLPVVLLVLLAWPLGRLQRVRIKAIALELAPFALLAAPVAYLAYRAQRASGAMHYAEGFTLVQRSAQACYGLCFYLVRTVWPADLSPAYVLDQRLDPNAPVFLAAFAAVAVGAALWTTALVRRRAPGVLAAFALYAAVVAPVLGFTQSGLQLVADRYTYLATMPFAVLLAAGLGAAGANRAVRAGALVAVLVLGVRTYDYAGAWKSSGTLFQRAVEVDDENWFAWTCLGTVAAREGRTADALALYDKAIAGDPDGAHLAYEGRATVRLQLGAADGAVRDCERASELNPRCPLPHVNLGSILVRRAAWGGAAAEFARAVELAPDLAVAWLNLGTARFQLGDRAGARAALERCAEEAAPGSPLLAECRKRLAALEGPP
jgi:tetratricopeptide (TPR) repeat protein